MKQHIKNFLILDILLIVIGYGTLFNQLDRQPLHDWDEGFYATNAIEMAFNGNYLVKYCDGKPEMLAVEPPLVAWIQTFFLKSFGYSELSLRLPSAIAGLLTAFLVIFFCTNELKNKLLGYFSAFVLLTAPGFVGNHVTRTADLDSLLVLFSTFYVIFFYKYIVHEKRQYFYLAVIGVILAVYTKSIAGLIMLFPLFVFTIYAKKLKFLFSHKELYLGILSFIIFVGGYYFLRELATPGYLKKVWYLEIAGRYTEPIDGKNGPFIYHLDNLFQSRFNPWFLLIPITFLIYILQHGLATLRKMHVIFLALLIILFGFIISKAETKVPSYDAQLYPYLSIVAAYFLYFIFKAIMNIKMTKLALNFCMLLFVLDVFYYPFISLVKGNITEGIHREYKYSFIMKKAKETKPDYKSYKILTVGWQPSVIYYSTLFNKAYGYNTRTVNGADDNNLNFGAGDTILFTHSGIFYKLNNGFNYEVVETYEEAALVKVLEKK